ncbi:MAG: glycosyltransferase family 4 protein [Ignavibacteria bacterium]|nr:glycosyltransferase family 4 protein [Ignavibacteria bacterium]
MTKVVIYNSSWGTFGGGEKYICALAESISAIAGCEVTLLIDTPTIAHDQLRSYFNIRLKKVAVSNIHPNDVRASLGSADLGIVTSNFRSFGTRAKKNIYVLQIPYSKITLGRIATRIVKENVKEGLKDFLRYSLLRSVRHADIALVYSLFTKETLARYHDVKCEVLYPAIDDFYSEGMKKNVILSVGRFFRGLYNDKRFDVLIEAFKQLTNRLGHSSSWEYRLVGSCSPDAASQQYLATLKEAARGLPISFHVNAPYDELRRHYNDATIFWHGTGYGVDETRYPERMEHFGMSTVEAMSAKAIPIVINKGGQKEIVRHGESGYLWNTLEELVTFTTEVINDQTIRSKMKERARDRFKDFDHEHFSSRVRSLISGLHLDS